jgi:hypothetical protein
MAGSLLAVACVRADGRVRASHGLGQAERAMRGDRGSAGAERALPALDRAGSLAPDEFRVHLRRAQMLLRLRRWGDGARAANRALALEPYSPNAWATLAAAHLGGGDAGAARAAAQRALGLLADNPLALAIDSRAALAQGDRAAAESGWKRLLALASSARDQATLNDARELLRLHASEDRAAPK